MTTSWLPPKLSYEAGDTPFKTASFGTTWTTMPTVCNIEYRVTIVPDLADPTLIVVDDQQLNNLLPTINIKVETNQVFYGGDHLTGVYTPGIYTVEVRTWADNDHDTGFFKQLYVEIVDPCFEMLGPSSEYLHE